MTSPDRSQSVLVTCRNASFGYQGHPILTGLNLEVKRGDVLGIVGGNGSGKTTLFRGLLGLIPPLSGSVERAERAIGYVPQREELDPVYPLTVREIVLMGASGGLRGARAWWRSPSKLDEARVMDSLAFVGLEDQAPVLFASLSGGQRQRCLLARALMPDPKLLMLDEPTAGVDRGAAQEIMARLRHLHSERQMAVLLVAHQMDLVRDLAEEVLVVEQGTVHRVPVSSVSSDASFRSAFQPEFRS